VSIHRQLALLCFTFYLDKY